MSMSPVTWTLSGTGAPGINCKERHRMFNVVGGAQSKQVDHRGRSGDMRYACRVASSWLCSIEMDKDKMAISEAVSR